MTETQPPCSPGHLFVFRTRLTRGTHFAWGKCARPVPSLPTCRGCRVPWHTMRRTRSPAATCRVLPPGYCDLHAGRRALHSCAQRAWLPDSWISHMRATASHRLDHLSRRSRPVCRKPRAPCMQHYHTLSAFSVSAACNLHGACADQ